MESEALKKENIIIGIIQLFYKPKSGFEIIIKKWEINHKIILLGLFGILNSIISISFNDPNIGLLFIKIIFKGLLGAAFGWISVWIMSQFINLLNILFGGESDVDDVIVVFSFALIPLIIGLLVNIITKMLFPSDLLIIPSIILIISFIWTFVLVLIGNKLISKINTFKNLISVLIPFILIILLSMLLGKLMN